MGSVLTHRVIARLEQRSVAALLLTVMALLAACGDDAPSPTATASASGTVTPLPVTTVPTSIPPQDRSRTSETPVVPRAQQVGTLLSVWLYEGARNGAPCVEIVADFAPASVVGQPEVIRGECFIDLPTSQRLIFEETSGGVFALDRVNILVLATDEPGFVHAFCDRPLFPVGGDPAEASRRTECEVEILPREEGWSNPLVWIVLPSEAEAASIPPTTPCSTLVRFYVSLEAFGFVHRLCTLR